MTFTIFSLVLIISIVFSVSKEAYNGYRKGSTKAIVSFLSVVFSLVMSTVISSRLISSAVSRGIVSSLSENRNFKTLFESIAQFDIIVQATISMIISSIVFVLVFLLLHLVCRAIIAIVYKNTLDADKDDTGYVKENSSWYARNDKRIGAIVGGISGFLMTVILFSPLIGTLKNVNSLIEIAGIESKIVEKDPKAVSLADEDEAQETATAETAEQEKDEEDDIVNVISDYANDFMGTVVYYCGGKAVYDMSARTVINGQTVILTQEIETIKSVTEDLVKVAPTLKDLNEFDSRDARRMLRVCEKMNDSYFLRLLSASVVSSASQNWSQGGKFLGISRPNFNSSIDPFCDSVFSVLAATTADTVAEDVSTFIRVCEIILDSGILKTDGNYKALMELLEESDFVDELTEELRRNPRTEPLMNNLHLLVMNSLVDTIKFDGYDAEEYYGLIEDITEQFNRMNMPDHEKKVEVLAGYTVEYLEDYGVDVPVEVAEIVADAMITSIPTDDGYITVEQDRKSTRLNSSHAELSRMPSSA